MYLQQTYELVALPVTPKRMTHYPIRQVKNDKMNNDWKERNKTVITHKQPINICTLFL